MIVSTELLLVIVLDEEATTMSTAAAEPVYSLLALSPSLSAGHAAGITNAELQTRLFLRRASI